MNTLFYKFFFSILLTVSLTLFVSIQFETLVRQSHSSKQIQLAIDKLVNFRDQLGEALELEDIDLAYQFFYDNPQYNQQILVFDSFHNEIFERKELKLSLLEKYFNHELTKEFKEQGIELHTTILSDMGNVFYLQIQPTMHYSPVFSPRTGGKFIRFFLFILFSAIICFLLVKTLTTRIKKLQTMTQHFIDGKPSSKYTSTYWGNDELGKLGHDFQEMIQQLELSQKQRKQILSDISHELRSPLSRMQVALAIARDKSPETELYIDKVEKEVIRMNSLITDIIQLQKLSLHNTQMLKQPLELLSLITMIIQDANFEYQHQYKSVILKTNKNEIYLNGNKEQLYRCFENIIRNALSHTQENTTVKVNIECLNDVYQIQVQDYGMGIAHKDLDNIFLPFVRLDSSRNRKTGGYGLGLAIAKAVIEQHNGEIYAQNNQHLSGLTITVNLPINNASK